MIQQLHFYGIITQTKAVSKVSKSYVRKEYFQNVMAKLELINVYIVTVSLTLYLGLYYQQQHSSLGSKHFDKKTRISAMFPASPDKMRRNSTREAISLTIKRKILKTRRMKAKGMQVESGKFANKESMRKSTRASNVAAFGRNY